MAIDSTSPRSRRAILLGAMAATGAGIFARVQPVNAGVDGDVVLGGGNGSTTMTLIVNDATDGQAFAAYGNGTGTGVEGRSGSGDGVFGNSVSGVGVHGLGDVAGVSGFSTGEGKGVKGVSTYGIGVYGSSNSLDAPAVLGLSSHGNSGLQGHSGTLATITTSPAKTGVYGYAAQDSASRGVTGESTSGRGVNGVATSGIGTFGHATSGEGVRGTSNGSNGVAGSSASGVASGVYGENTGGGAGTYGRSNQAGGNGAFGESSVGIGVHGTTDTGTGGYFSANDGGTALHTSGRVQLDNCCGVAAIPAGSRSISVVPGIELTVHSAVVATLMGYAGGTTTVQHVLVSAVNNRFTINLTKATPDGVKVAWLVLG